MSRGKKVAYREAENAKVGDWMELEGGGFRIEVMETLPEGVGAYQDDRYHMGRNLGTNAMMMYANYDDAKCNYIILINYETRQRIKIHFTDKSEAASNQASFIDMLIKNPHLYGG